MYETDLVIPTNVMEAFFESQEEIRASARYEFESAMGMEHSYPDEVVFPDYEEDEP